jgi:hypothetical protein
MPHPDWLRKYECCFAIASEDSDSARLLIIPRGYEKDKDGQFDPHMPNQLYGLYVTARIDNGQGFKYDMHDFVSPTYFRELEMVVAESTDEGCLTLLEGDDGRLDIRFERVSNGRLAITTNAPSPRFRGDFLRMQFEGTVNAESLLAARKQVRALLEVVDKINSDSIGT